MNDFGAGANIDGKHYFGINWGRDVELGKVEDLRNVVEGDPSPCGKGTLMLKRGIEVGHIFQLGTNYSEKMNCGVLDSNGKNVILEMGCYGIGVSRVVAAAIEQNHDDYGIIWPDAIAPFQVAIVPMNMHKSERVQQAAEKLYAELTAAGIEVLFDDRKERPGVMFSDMELIGVPHTIIIGDRSMDEGHFESKIAVKVRKKPWQWSQSSTLSKPNWPNFGHIHLKRLPSSSLLLPVFPKRLGFAGRRQVSSSHEHREAM